MMKALDFVKEGNKKLKENNYEEAMEFYARVRYFIRPHSEDDKGVYYVTKHKEDE